MAWVLVTLKNYPMFSRQWIHEAFHYDMKNTLGMGFNKYKSLYNGTYADNEELERLKKYLTSKLEKNISLIWKVCKKWKNECEELLDYTKYINKKDIHNYSNEKLIELLDDIIRKLRRTASYLYLHHGLSAYFEKWLNKLLDTSNIDKHKKTLYFQVLSSPIKSTLLSKANNELKEISKFVEKNKFEKSKYLIKTYTEKFKWLGYDTAIGKDLTIKETKSNILSILQQKEPKSSSISRKKILYKLHLTNKDKQLLDLISEIVYLSTYRATTHMIVGSNIRSLIEEIAKRLNTNYENLVQLTFDEIKNALYTRKTNSKEIERRKKKYGLLMINGKNTVYSGDKVNKIEEAIETPKDKDKLSGMIAQPGKVTGYARLILNKKDFTKVKSGDILVTKMTNPDFIVVLEKCKGIITDIGGVTSHAAIIARELHKPCIIGTKFATTILKDGDLIEVDANQGIVKKLK